MNGSEQRLGEGKPVLALLAIGGVLLALSGSTHNGWLVLLAALSFGLVAGALVLRPRLGGLDVDVRLPARCTAGDVVTAHVVVTNRGSRPCSAATLHLHAPGLHCATVAIPPLAVGASATADVAVTTFARVALTGLATLVRSAAPFGLVTVTKQATAPASMLVRPVPERPMERVPAGSGGGSEHSRPGPGVDVQGIREWRHGDSARRLHVRSTARHGRPIVLDRHDDLATGIAVVVGGGGSDGHPLWEPMIAVVASTLAEASLAGDRIAAVTANASRVASAAATPTRATSSVPPALPDAPYLPDLRGGSAEEALDWCARLTWPAPPCGEAVLRAASAVGGGAVVVADLLWSTDAAWWSECVAAAQTTEVELLVLHAIPGRTDALCLHGADNPHAEAHNAAVAESPA